VSASISAAARSVRPRSPQFAALDQQISDEIREFNALQKTRSVAALLARFNEPARIHADHEHYNALLAFGDATSQPGAELDAAWYLRNARIFAKLIQIARSGDRVIVVFGAGHAYWLRHFVETTPGFQRVEPDRYLVALCRRRWTDVLPAAVIATWWCARNWSKRSSESESGSVRSCAKARSRCQVSSKYPSDLGL
jgi:hypothetical protein